MPGANGAFTVYAQAIIDQQFIIKGSFAKTEHVWPGTANPTPPMNEFEASKVSSLDIGASYTVNPYGNIIWSVSGEFSNFRAGSGGSPWERQNQTVLGIAGLVNGSSRLFLEVFRTKGYAPLNFISGGNFEDPTQTHSDRDASSIGIVLGGQLTI